MLTADDTSTLVQNRLLMEYQANVSMYANAVDIVKATLEYRLLGLRSQLLPFERIQIVGRVKSFDSASAKLQQRQEGNFFDPERLDDYTFGSLTDMAGVKVQVCPNSYLKNVHDVIKKAYPSCTEDHKPARGNKPYSSYVDEVDQLQYCVPIPPRFGLQCVCEIQVVPWILDRYREIEHDILYKPHSSLSKRVREELTEYDKPVVQSIKTFMQAFGRMLQDESRFSSIRPADIAD